MPHISKRNSQDPEKAQPSWNELAALQSVKCLHSFSLPDPDQNPDTDTLTQLNADPIRWFQIKGKKGNYFHE